MRKCSTNKQMTGGILRRLCVLLASIFMCGSLAKECKRESMLPRKWWRTCDCWSYSVEQEASDVPSEPEVGTLRQSTATQQKTLRFAVTSLHGTLIRCRDRKRTTIWTNTNWTPARPLCRHDCASSNGKTHTARAQQGPPGPRFTQKQLYRIPEELCGEIASFCTGL